MTNKEVLSTAMRQSAIESGCSEKDFLKSENVIVKSVVSDKARIYLELPFVCDFTSYGNNVVASVKEEHEDIVRDYLSMFPPERMFETPAIYMLDDNLKECGMRVCFQSAYYLPDVNELNEEYCNFEFRILNKGDFDDLYVDDWSYALCEKRKELDVLGVGAYSKEGRLVGLAACSEDCETMWQIGINVLPGFQREGIASSITKKLAKEILKRDKVPFYRSPWCNIRSIRNAIKSGFRPAWCQMTVKDVRFVNKMMEDLKKGPV